MRSLATWLVVGGLAVLGLFAVRDALHGEEARPAAATGITGAEGRPQSPPGFAGPPRIAGLERLARQLRALGAEGVLYLTDANCRRFLLRLPSLEWTPQGLPGPVCPDATVVDERFGLEARQVDADVIEVHSEDWHLRFAGTAPAFRPEGRLTFLRDGRLFEWTVRCPPAAERVVFRGLHTLVRCPRRVPGAPEHLQELVWLNGNSFAAVAGPERAASLVVVRDGVATRLFNAVGARVGALSASPHGRYVAARVDASLVVFDVRRRGALAGGTGARAIAWSPDERFWAVATESSVAIFRSTQPGSAAVSLPLSAFALSWR
jgi:hypothetical protein